MRSNNKSSQVAAQPPQTDEAPAPAPRKRGRPRSIATTASGSQTSRASREIESSGQGEQQNTSQAAENPDQNLVHSLYRMMLAWGEAMGSKEKSTDAFKKAGIIKDQIGSIEPSPVVQGFQTAATALSRLQHAASQGANQGGMQNAAVDIGILLYSLGHFDG
ncbi:putative 1b protein [Sesbania bispinosa]|nr:putative 1b protein [Sesbania bispinosa]